MLDGVIVIDKPRGWTSHDVVAKVKATLGAKKVGHLGTLDPVATGVLPLVVNGATRFARILEGSTKVYEATLKLGTETDTLDSEGRVTETRDAAGVTAGEITEAFASFRGRIAQVPPMYSSVKRGGVPLYKLARKGVVVEREPKEVEITSLDVLKVALPSVDFRLSCSKGTYVRTLCSDVGRRLGCGAHMVGLRRTASGEFTLDGAIPPDSGAEVLEHAVIPLGVALERALDLMRTVEVPAAAAVGLKNSATVTVAGADAFFSSLRPKEMVRFVSSGRLAAVAEFAGAEFDPSKGVFSVVKVFKEGTSAAEALRIRKIS